MKTKRRKYEYKNDYWNCCIGSTAGSDYLPADQEQKKEWRQTMSERCVFCGRFVPRERKICDTCLKEIAENGENLYGRPTWDREEKEKMRKAAYIEELKRLFSVCAEIWDEDDDEDEDFDEDEGIVLNICIPYGCRNITINIEEE